MNNTRPPYIIAFPHPGREHINTNPGYQYIDYNNISANRSIDSRKKAGSKMLRNLRKTGHGQMWWNNAEHRRKFFKADGQYITFDKDDFLSATPLSSELLFWGEMEYPTYVNTIPYSTQPSFETYPQFVHSPVPQKRFDITGKTDEELYKTYNSIVEKDGEYISDRRMGYQNTDPYVFGDSFYYCCCKQGRAGLQALQPGDIIIYYSRQKSTAQSGFSCMIDTVFVIGEIVGTYGKNHLENIRHKVSPLYLQNCIMPVIYGCGSNVSTEDSFTLYKAATFNSPINGIFSYFPCKPYTSDKNCGFPRFELENGIINDNVQLTVQQNYKLFTCDDISDSQKTWLELTKKISDEGYLLGISAKEPDFL